MGIMRRQLPAEGDMSWKYTALLTAVLGIGGGQTASAGDLGIGIQVNPSPAYPPRHRPPVKVIQPIYQPVYPSPGVIISHPRDHRDLERRVERCIKRHLGHCVDDIDVDIDCRRRHAKIEADVRHRDDYRRLERLLYSLPELAGYEICLDVELDD
jgi:hypothetical protein